LFVVPAFRSRGIGRAIMGYLADLAVRHQCAPRLDGARLEQTVMGFYRRLGAKVLTGADLPPEEAQRLALPARPRLARRTAASEPLLGNPCSARALTDRRGKTENGRGRWLCGGDDEQRYRKRQGSVEMATCHRYDLRSGNGRWLGVARPEIPIARRPRPVSRWLAALPARRCPRRSARRHAAGPSPYRRSARFVLRPGGYVLPRRVRSPMSSCIALAVRAPVPASAGVIGYFVAARTRRISEPFDTPVHVGSSSARIRHTRRLRRRVFPVSQLFD
jgi:hypothetical protein